MLSDELQVDAIARTLKGGGPAKVRLYGRSMMPMLLPGALLEFDPVDPAACRPGDVVLVRRGDVLTAHRWVGGARDAWVLQGDALARPDPPVTDEQVLGRARGVPFARTSLPLPPATVHLLLAARPALRWTAGAIRVLGRASWRRAQRSPIVEELRRRSMPWSIERFEAHHLPEIRRLALRRSTRPDRALLASWESILASERSVAYLARGRGIVGHAIVREDVRDPAVGVCGYLWTSRWYRGLGVASALLRAAVDHVRPLGYRELRADVRRGSDAQRSFERLGFDLAPDMPVPEADRIGVRLRFSC